MKYLRSIMTVVLAMMLFIGLAYAETARLGSDRSTFNPTRSVTKTAAYTLTTSDSEVKFTAASANIVATLPSEIGRASCRERV